MKILKVTTVDEIQSCGECFWALDDHTCEKTGSKIEDYWRGVLDDCPLPEVEDDNS